MFVIISNVPFHQRDVATYELIKRDASFYVAWWSVIKWSFHYTKTLNRTWIINLKNINLICCYINYLSQLLQDAVLIN